MSMIQLQKTHLLISDKNHINLWQAFDNITGHLQEINKTEKRN